MTLLFKMIYLLFMAAIFMLVPAQNATGQNGDNNSFSLQEFEWERRILVIAAPDRNAEAYRNSLTMLESNRSGMEERHMLIVLLPDSAEPSLMLKAGDQPEIDPQKLRNQLNLKPDQLSFLLIGKDGGVKMREQDSLSLKSVFNRIDQMPMRKQEMKKQGDY